MTKLRKPASRKVPTAKPPKVVSKPTSKIGQLEAMLRRSKGATLPQLVKVLDWQAHSVRGAMSGYLKKKQGLACPTAGRVGRLCTSSSRPAVRRHQTFCVAP